MSKGDSRVRYPEGDNEESVDHVGLTHEDGDEEVGDGDLAKIVGVRVRAAADAGCDEDGHVHDEHDAEQPPVEREHLETDIAEDVEKQR